MLKVGLTGGIGAGKSAVASRLASLGAVVIDSDVLAREVVAPGTPGLDRVVDTFGRGVLDASGALDRAALAELVFGDHTARSTLEGIVHPLVRQRADALTATAASDAIVVNDVPLLVEVGLAPTFDLVIVVEAPEDVRLERLVGRGLPEDQARARVATQASVAARRSVADAVIDNSGTPAELDSSVERLWRERLVPFEDNKRRCRAVWQVADDTAPSLFGQARPAAFERVAARLRHVLGETAHRVDHIGPSAVPELATNGVIDIQVTVADLTVADANRETLATAGFPAIDAADGAWTGPPAPVAEEERVHGGTDPALPVHIRLRSAGSASARWALLLRDWLRADAAARDTYANGEEPHAGAMLSRAEEWARRTRWTAA